MYKVTQEGDNVSYGIYQAVCDTVSDIATLPTNWSAGSTALVIANSAVYMLGNDEEWHEI